jgi:hypothetical protein
MMHESRSAPHCPGCSDSGNADLPRIAAALLKDICRAQRFGWQADPGSP